MLGQQVVVESKPGAASSIAAAEVARADKDGYTLFMLSSANITNEAINPKLPFNIAKDFAPVALVNTTAVILAVHPSLGVNDLKELIALAKSKPGELNYASTGVGTAPHLSGELLASATGIKILHVPYKGSPEAATDLLAGRVVDDVLAGLGGDRAGQGGQAEGARHRDRPASRRICRTCRPWRRPACRLRDLDLVRPGGAGRHAAPVIDKLAKAVAEATSAPEVAKAWEPQGILPLSGGPDVFARYIASESKRWGEVAAAAGLKK